MRYFLPILIVLCAILSGCNSGPQKLHDTCSDLEKAAQLTDNCEQMASKLPTPLKALATQIDDLANVTDPAQQKAYLEEMSTCTQALLKIRTESCKNHDGVTAALNLLPTDK